MTELGFNKVCEVEDFRRPQLAVWLRETYNYRAMPVPSRFPDGQHDREAWETAMVTRSLQHFGVLRRGGIVLGVGLGERAVCFYLARQAHQLFAADRYLDRAWPAGLRMMTNALDLATVPIDGNGLVVQHMDPRRLRYPDDSFDAVAWAQTHHLETLGDAAAAAYEIGRVLKPDGVVSMLTMLRLAGPHGGTGLAAGRLLLSAPEVQRFVIDASGLEPVDEVQLTPSDGTLGTERRLSVGDTQPVRGSADLISVTDGYVSTSAHLTLRKTGAYPLVDNGWARPSPSTLDRIGREAQAALSPS